MARTTKQRAVGYGDLRYLKQLVKIALHESLADPDRSHEILNALHRDATSLHDAYVHEVRFARDLRRLEARSATRWESKYHAARFRVKQQAQRISEQWIGDQLDNGFNPHGFFIYLLWENPDQPIYIGQSSNVCGRLGTHVSSNYGWRIKDVTLIRCQSEEQMKITEAELIDLYQPELNRAGKRAPDPANESHFEGRYAPRPLADAPKQEAHHA